MPARSFATPAKAQDMLLPDDIVHRIFAYRLLPRQTELLGECGVTEERDVVPAAGISEEEGRERMRAALGMVNICKVSQPNILKALYHTPHITSIRALQSFTESLIRGEKRWDGLRRIASSIPGRYLVSLDLSHMTRGLQGQDTSMDHLLLNSCLTAIFPLAPNLASLALPKEIALGWGTMQTLMGSPLIRGIKVLKGLRVIQLLNGEGKDPLISLLENTPALEILEVEGMGEADVGLEWDEVPTSQVVLNLPKLHTVRIKGVKNGLLMASLVKSRLRGLKVLAITSYQSRPDDMTQEMIETHGDKLLSLTFLPHSDWPPLYLEPPTTTLADCPSLLHLSYLISTTLPSEETFSSPLTISTTLRTLTISRWTSISPQHSSTVPSETFFTFLLNHLPTATPALRAIRIENFIWLKRDLGRAAMETGVNGSLRKWAGKFALRGIEILDREGKGCPPGMGAAGMMGGRVGVPMMGQGILGMKGVGQRRRVSMDTDDDGEDG